MCIYLICFFGSSAGTFPLSSHITINSYQRRIRGGEDVDIMFGSRNPAAFKLLSLQVE